MSLKKLILTDEEIKTTIRAAHLCKADLATQMVNEFPDLQGVMGYEYALKSGESPEVACAILEHYMPRSAEDTFPETTPGLVLGLVDRLDSLMGLFAVGIIPTGSSDPYGLRRCALGIIRNLIYHQVSFSVQQGLEKAASLLPIETSEESISAAVEFVTKRLKIFLCEQGCRHDIVNAVLAVNDDDPALVYQSVKELSVWIVREDWNYILNNYARCVRIVSKFDKQFPLDTALFIQLAEKELYDTYKKASEYIASAKSLRRFLITLVSLADVIDRFFAKESGVLVMAEDQALRENRLALLQKVVGLCDEIVDLSQLENF